MSAFNTSQPYVAHVFVEKHECINHTNEQMHKGLQNVIKKSTARAKETRSRAITSDARAIMITSLG